MNIEDYPFVMNASQLAKFLQVSRPTAYELMRRTDFPSIRILVTDTSRGSVRVLRDDVVEWLKKQREEQKLWSTPLTSIAKFTGTDVYVVI